jgi:putative selenate reductase
MKLGQIGKDGRKEVEPIEGEFINITVDSVISAIGEHVNKESLHMNKIRMAHNRAVVNEWNETEIPNVFIGGDALRGPSTVIESIADGKKTAEAIIKKEHLEYLSIPAKKYFVDDPLLFEDIDNRKGNIVYQSPQDIISEANRCLGCNFICNKCEEVCPNRANIAVIEDSKFFKDKFQILHIDSMCNECGNCETFCPYQGAPYKEKPTLFDNEHDFRLSRNNGFFLIREENQIIANIRWKSERGTITFDNMHEVIKSSYFDQKEIESLTQLIKNLLKNYFYLLSFTDV